MNKSLLILTALIVTTGAQAAYLPGTNMLTTDTIRLITKNTAAFGKAATINAYAGNPTLTQAFAEQMRNNIVLKSNAAFYNTTANYITVGVLVATWAVIGYCAFIEWKNTQRIRCARTDKEIAEIKAGMSARSL